MVDVTTESQPNSPPITHSSAGVSTVLQATYTNQVTDTFPGLGSMLATDLIIVFMVALVCVLLVT